ncbi:NAD-dependent succinate-semialdehyde dehydrogenase [Paenibacillus tyrfis]|uniref:Aldehyde dehydrogenase n=1 Tax=Paenibacillus tyrfis TaxID=1501230 RepID=A0A081NVF7_9BACL|nr:NAD-dependent succinate-semialdehyde dehydrogenase [Paenibacillus tyrfis]KEQ22430.1 succinate-semialdehyde dehydrogenase [Paenibacillus tyrfis]
MSGVKRMYINGEWIEAKSRKTINIYNPATREVVGEITYGGREETRRAIEAANAAFKEWATSTAKVRAKFLSKLGALIAKNRDELATIMASEMGKPIKEGVVEVLSAADNFNWYAEEAKRVYGETIPSTFANKRLHVMKAPVGVTAAITPWNFPMSMVARKLAPALAAGCTVILKPSELSPLSAIRIFELIEEAGFPRGVANVVLGEPTEVGNEFMENQMVKKITFTGSTRVGKLLYQQAANQVKRVSLELGGHAPFIVFEDADIDLAVKGLVESKFLNAGQTCISANRLYVHESIADEFTKKLVARMERIVVGDGRNAETEIGPLVNEAGLNKVLSQIEDAKQKGASILIGGHRLTGEDYDDGYYCAPTVLAAVSPNMKILTEETFGPVVPLVTFSDDEEVINMANNSDYGLAAYIYSQNVKRCLTIPEKLEYGIIGVNDSVPTQTQAPFGGIKNSGLGREGGKWGIEGFLETKLVSYGV